MISFAEKYPDLVAEWAEENESRPEKVSYGSNMKVIWNGRCGHTWEASVKNRGHKHGCPYCSGNKVMKGVNDLATLFPELADEWDESNKPLMPDMVSRRADRKITWKCLRCGQTWQSRIADRTAGHGCPVCSGERLVKGINDFQTEYPKIASEWSQKNRKKPSEVWSKSRENVWWTCGTCGHEWKGVIDSRVKGTRCPECRKREQQVRVPYHNVIEERSFKKDVIAYYANKSGVVVDIGSDDVIGVELDAYFPTKKAAVLYSRALCAEFRVRRERAVNWLCLNAGIKLFRILSAGANEYDNCICITLENRSLEVLSLAIQTVFDVLGTDVDVDIERDLLEIKSFSKKF